jgi:hypothetical protein
MLDERNPYNNLDVLYDLEDEEDREGLERDRKNCACDNCFYGRTELALEILRLRGETG